MERPGTATLLAMDADAVRKMTTVCLICSTALGQALVTILGLAGTMADDDRQADVIKHALGLASLGYLVNEALGDEDGREKFFGLALSLTREGTPAEFLREKLNDAFSENHAGH